MNRRQKYFLKQKLIGVAMVFGSILLAIIMDYEAFNVFPIIMVPLGLLLIFTKQMAWQDDYWWETVGKERIEKIQKGEDLD